VIEVPLAVAAPFVGCAETMTLAAAPPVMFSVIASLVELAATFALTAPATGGGGLTVIETVAGADAPVALDAVYWKLSAPT